MPILPIPLPPVLVIPFTAIEPFVIRFPPVMLPVTLRVAEPVIAPTLEIVLAEMSPALLVVTDQAVNAHYRCKLHHLL